MPKYLAKSKRTNPAGYISWAAVCIALIILTGFVMWKVSPWGWLLLMFAPSYKTCPHGCTKCDQVDYE